MVKVPVQMRYRGEPGHTVELAGDFPDWKYPVSMPEHAPGDYRCELHLEPGIYRYKFKLDGRHWVMDPNACAVDVQEGYRNALLIIGGISEPVRFAPGRNQLMHLEDGRWAIHAEADRGELPACMWLQQADGTISSHSLTRHQRPNGHVLLRAEGSNATAGAAFGFTGAPEAVFTMPAARTPSGAPPPWLHGAVFYAIFVDRWRRGSASAPDPRASARTVRSTPDTFYGGDLDGIAESLEQIRSLGVDALVLTPIHRSNSPHRYDGFDLLTVDPRLGGEASLQRLVQAAHGLDLRVIVDAAFTHVHEDHLAFQDVLRHQQHSEFASWFRIRRFPVQARNPETYEHYYNGPHLPWLNLRPGPAREHVIKAAERLLQLGVDGLRLDAMNDAPDDFWMELRTRARSVNAGALLLGEIVSDNPARLAEERGVDTATDFQHREAMVEMFARNRMTAAEFVDRVLFQQHRVGPVDPAFRLLFLDNHDTPRFMTLAANYDRLRVALTWLLLRPEPVWLTYGTELGMFGGAVVREFDAAWPERIPMPAHPPAPTQTEQLIRSLCTLRKELPGLRAPDTELHAGDHRVLVMDRGPASQRVRVVINASDAAASAQSFLPPGARHVLSVNAAGLDAQGVLPPWSAHVVMAPS